MPRRLVIIGSGMAAFGLLEQITKAAQFIQGTDSRFDITVLSREADLPYNRAMLTSVLAGRHRPQDISLRTEQWYVSHGIRIISSDPATKIDTRTNQITLASKEVLGYDVLVLATGSVPIAPPASRDVAALVHTLTTLSDCMAVKNRCADARNVTVVGGGSLGIEVAVAVTKIANRVPVRLLEAAAHLLPNTLDPPSAAPLELLVKRSGVQVHTGTRVVGIKRARPMPSEATRHSAQIRLDDGASFRSDVVIWACGTQPNTSLAKLAGITVNKGIAVNDHMQSVSHPNVFAIGDCAEWNGQTSTQIHQAWAQAAVVCRALGSGALGSGALGSGALGSGALGSGADKYSGAAASLRLRSPQIPLAAFGEFVIAGKSHDTEVVELYNSRNHSYRRLVVKNGKLVGAVLVGDLSSAGLLAGAVDNPHLPLPSRQELVFGPIKALDGTSGASIGDDATICVCNGVSAGAIRAQAASIKTATPGLSETDCINDSLDAVRAATRATSGCGGCTETVVGLLNAQAAQLCGTDS